MVFPKEEFDLSNHDEVGIVCHGLQSQSPHFMGQYAAVTEYLGTQTRPRRFICTRPPSPASWHYSSHERCLLKNGPNTRAYETPFRRNSLASRASWRPTGSRRRASAFPRASTP